MIETIQLRLLLATFAGWVCRKQMAMIVYLIEENRVRKEQLQSGGRRLRVTDDQRRRLAAKGKPLGRRMLRQMATIVTLDTILAWHRRLIAAKWTFVRKRVGRPGVMKEIREQVVRMAEENPSWGYARMQGALKHLGHRVARSTIAKVLKEHGIKPVPGSADELGDLRSCPRGRDCSGRLLHNRSVDGAGVCPLLHSVCHGHCLAAGPHRGGDDESDFGVDGADGAEPD